MVTASNSGGATSTTLQISVDNPTPPSNLVYPQTKISATVGQSITPDTPTFSGTVSSFRVDPVLPIGLSLDNATGTIAGTPTATVVQTAYKVTATNLGGSTSAILEISVVASILPPTALRYPQTEIVADVGREITPDIPGSAGGPITQYSVSPALPPGLKLDPSTGVISGTPAAPATKAVYVVTGSNSSGRVNAAVNPAITVTVAPITLLQLGNHKLLNLRFVNSSVLSQDQSTWTLWDFNTGNVLSSGDHSLGARSILGAYPGAEMAGPTLAIGIPGGIQVRSSSDGHVLGTIVSPGLRIYSDLLMEDDSWQLAIDGSYISVETHAGLFIYAPNGHLIVSRQGDYLDSARNVPGVFAAPHQVQIANGPGGPSAIEIVSVSDASSVVTPIYQGTFQSWFSDGVSYITAAAGYTQSWIYSSSGVQQGLVSGPVAGGVGNWIWRIGTDGLEIYALGSVTPALLDSHLREIYSSGTTLFGTSNNSASVIDLSGKTPLQTDYPIPSSVLLPTPPFNSLYPEYNLYPFAAVSSARWVVAYEVATAENDSSMVLDGSSFSTGVPRYLGIGAAFSIAGGTAFAAVATGGGKIFYFDTPNGSTKGSIALESGKIQLSSDASVLGASSIDGSLLNLYSLPSGTIDNSFSYSRPGLLSDFTLSLSATTLGQIFGGSQYQVSALSGSPVIWSGAPQTPDGPILLSPDGSLIAFTVGHPPDSAVTIYKNGQQITAVNGAAVGWIDNGRLLVNNYSSGINPRYTGCTIYSPTGVILANPPLPALQAIQPASSDAIYAPNVNAIYSISTGRAIWTSPYPSDDPYAPDYHGAVSGEYIVFQTQGRLVALKY